MEWPWWLFGRGGDYHYKRPHTARSAKSQNLKRAAREQALGSKASDAARDELKRRHDVEMGWIAIAGVIAGSGVLVLLLQRALERWSGG